MIFLDGLRCCTKVQSLQTGDCTFYSGGLYLRTFSSIGGFCKLDVVPYLFVTHLRYCTRGIWKIAGG